MLKKIETKFVRTNLSQRFTKKFRKKLEKSFFWKKNLENGRRKGNVPAQIPLSGARRGGDERRHTSRSSWPPRH
jgi:hypothetical protein